MKPKITWMHFLHIGISAIIILFTNSCDKGEVSYLLTTNFIYKNLTPEPVQLQLYDNTGNNFKNYTIPVDSEITISLKQSGGKTGVGQPFGYPSEGVANKVVIVFTSSRRCLSNSKILSVKDYDNFSESMYNLSNNTLIYKIDSEEFDLATNCLK